jgi:cleavage and polyadenylation specificity factor subunit 1
MRIFTQFYIVKIDIIKNFIVLCDAVRSVTFLLWNETNYSLTVVSRDFSKSFCLLSSLVIDGNKLGFLSADIDGNLRLLQYNPR